MSLTLLIALVVSIPFAGLCWLCAAGIDRLGAGIRLRVIAWTLAICLPIILIPGALTVDALDVHSRLADIRVQLQPVPATTIKQTALAEGIRPPVKLMPWVEGFLAMLALGAVGQLAALCVAALRVARAVAIATPISEALFDGSAPVRQTDFATPMLAGLVRPVILIPRRLLAAMTAEQIRLICAHEQAHLAARDHIAHFLEDIAVRIFWFNLPLLAIRKRLEAAREEACDARVLTSCDDHTRRVYAQSLLAAFRVAGEDAPAMAFTGKGRGDAKRRLRSILYPHQGTVSAAFAATAAAGLLLLTTGGLSIALAAQPLPQIRTLIPAHNARQALILPSTSAASVSEISVAGAPVQRREPRRSHSQQVEQAERIEAVDRPEQAELPELPERPEQPERPEIPERP